MVRVDDCPGSPRDDQTPTRRLTGLNRKVHLGEACLWSWSRQNKKSHSFQFRITRCLVTLARVTGCEKRSVHIVDNAFLLASVCHVNTSPFVPKPRFIMSALTRSQGDSGQGLDPTGRLTSREYDHMMYYQFVRRDTLDEFGNIRKKATNGWQVEGGMTASDQECVISFTGRIPLNNEAMLEFIKCSKHNAFCLSNVPAAVFYPINDNAQQLSPYYTYTFKAKEAWHAGPRGKKVYYVDMCTIKWEPLQMNTPIALHVFANCMVGKQYSKLRHIMAMRLKQQSASRQYTLQDLQLMLGEDLREVNQMLRVGEIKRLFFHSVMAPLYKYYDADDLDFVSINKLSYMSKIVSDSSTMCNPSTLCYQSMCSADNIVCRDRDRMWFLPELSLAQYIDICNAKKYKYTNADYAALRIYATLKNIVNDEGSTCAEYNTLLDLSLVTDKALARQAMYLLTDQYEAVVVEERRRNFFNISAAPTVSFVYRKEDYVHEELIVHAIEKTIKTFIKSPPPYVGPDVASQYRLLPKNEICSEQLQMLEHIKVLPIPIVKGPGGTGKSELLSHGLAMMDAIKLFQETKFVTYQANNASEAAKRNTPYATTCHRMMAKHYNKCKCSPKKRPRVSSQPSTPARPLVRSSSSSSSSFSRAVVHIPTVASVMLSDSTNGEEPEEPEEEPDFDEEYGFFEVCPLENVTRLILDEAGLMYEGLIAAVLHILTTCGKLAQIIICGDDRQQVQMQPGEFQKAIFKGFLSWTLEFTHMHRFKSSAASILAHNAKAINDMRPEDLVIEPGVWEFFPLKKYSYQLKTSVGKEELRQELMARFRSIGFSDNENSMLVTRTHELRELGMSALEEIQFGNVIPNALRVGQKILCKDTINDLGIVAREIYILLRIEDCSVPPKRTLKSLEAKEYKKLEVKSVSFDDTVTTHKSRGLARRLVARPLGSLPGEDGKYPEIIIPYDQQFRSKVIRASSITERACQGSEGNFILCLKPSFWKEADFKETFYVVATRPRERFVILTQAEYISKWAKNPSPPRETRLAEKLQRLHGTYSTQLTLPPDTEEIRLKKEEEAKSGIYVLQEIRRT